MGEVASKPLGQYPYKKIELGGSKLLDVTVYPLLVKKLKEHWLEERERKRKWFDPRVAAGKVDEPELAALLKALAKRISRGEEPLKL